MFSSPDIGCLTKLKEISLSYYLPVVVGEGHMDSWILSKDITVKCNANSLIQDLVSLINGISTLHGLFNAEILIISKCLIVIITTYI